MMEYLTSLVLYGCGRRPAGGACWVWLGGGARVVLQAGDWDDAATRSADLTTPLTGCCCCCWCTDADKARDEILLLRLKHKKMFIIPENINKSCCSTDSERPHRCCHLPNKVENIDHGLDIPDAYTS